MHVAIPHLNSNINLVKMNVSVDPKYFDYAASAPPWPAAVEAFSMVSKDFYANPSSIHLQGKKAKQMLLELKKAFCDLLQFYDGRLLLCASGSEAGNTIIEGHLVRLPTGKILMARDVHDCVWYSNKKYVNKVRVFPLESSGHYDPGKFAKALGEDISLVCINHVCNETGAIQPVEEIADICHQRNVKLMIDGVQALGHIPVNMNEIPCTYYTFSGHKFGSVRGVAGVLIRDDQFDPLIKGGKQEWELRAGTENVPGLSSMVEALKRSNAIMEEENGRLRKLKNRIVQKLKEVEGIKFNSVEPDLPGLLSVSLPGFSGKEIVGALSVSDFAVSTGSACHSNQMEPSRVIRAMGRTTGEAVGSIRISMGTGTTVEAVDALMEELFDLIK